MVSTRSDVPRGSSRWTARLAWFAVALIVTAIFLHRVFAMPTPVAFLIVAAAYGLAALAVLLGLIAAIGIWRDGTPGAARILFGMTVGGLVLAAPLLLLVSARNYPMLNDLTTDPANPPGFRALAAERKGLANPAAYPGNAFAGLQNQSYPDLVPISVNRPVSETFDLVVEALRRLHFTVVTEDPPSEENPTGTAEAVDRTLILGFYDDIAVRVTAADEGASRIDLRSSSRYGRSDFGRNAQRLREIMREIVARLEATVPVAGAEKDTPNKKSVKPPKAGDRESKAARKQRDDARPNVRRAPEQKATPP